MKCKFKKYKSIFNNRCKFKFKLNVNIKKFRERNSNKIKKIILNIKKFIRVINLKWLE
jgi:hypothetical protein